MHTQCIVCTIRKCVRQGQRTDETQLTLSHNLRPVHRLPIGRTWQWREGREGFLTIFTLQNRFCRPVKRGRVECSTFYYLTISDHSTACLLEGHDNGGEENFEDSCYFWLDFADKSKGDELNVQLFIISQSPTSQPPIAMHWRDMTMPWWWWGGGFCRFDLMFGKTWKKLKRYGLNVAL